VSLAGRDHMRPPRPGRVTRLDGRPVDGVVLEAEPARSSRIHAPRWRRSPLRVAVIGLAALAAFTGAWAIGCGLIGASLHTDGGTFVPPAAKQLSQRGQHGSR
jgi:hypothetical protein